MNDRDAMQLLLCALLLLSCLTRLIRRTLCALQGDRALPVVMLSAGFLLFSGALCGIIERFAGSAMLLPALLLLTIFGTCAALLQSLVSLRTLRQLLPALGLAAWIAAFITGTVLLRQPVEALILLRFDVLADVSRLHSLRPLRDVLLNLLLLFPLGVLLPLADRAPHVWLNTLSTVLLLSAAAEGVQLLFSLGQADVEDLAANVLGAMAGCGLSQLLRRRA